MTGIFITLEGPDGAGKSTQTARLAERLERETRREVVVTREPGGTPVGERVRAVVLASGAGDRDPLTDALLFNAARRQLVAELIGPALERGAVVVCDRFTDSTLAYQGYGAGADLAALRTLAAVATGGRAPDRTVLIDVPVATGLSRRHAARAADLTRFELDSAHGAAFHERVLGGYHDLVKQEPRRWRVVDATADADEVADAVWAAVSDLFAS